MIIGELRAGQAGVRERKPVPGMVVDGWVAAVCKVCKVYKVCKVCKVVLAFLRVKIRG